MEQHSLQEVIQALSVFDKDDDGVISIEDLGAAMRSYGVGNEDGTNSKMQKEEFEVMKKALQDEGNIINEGKIVIEELAKLFLNIKDEEEPEAN